MKEKQLIETIVEGIQEKKGKKITTVDLSDIESAAASYFVICEGQSTTQVAAIADSVREYVQQHTGIKPFGYDGYQNSQWIIIDYGSILAHIFLASALTSCPKANLTYPIQPINWKVSRCLMSGRNNTSRRSGFVLRIPVLRSHGFGLDFANAYVKRLQLLSGITLRYATPSPCTTAIS